MSKSKSKCPECGGSGVVVLLTSSRPCKICAAQNEQAVLDSAPPNMEYTFDSQGRLTQAVCSHPAGAVTTYTYYDLEPDGPGKDGREKSTAWEEPPRIGPSTPAPLDGDKRPYWWYADVGQGANNGTGPNLK
jgi:hypothetical protein